MKTHKEGNIRLKKCIYLSTTNIVKGQFYFRLRVKIERSFKAIVPVY